ncbi:SGNH/GDSL hydrolase family protein [Planctomicrobium sp. SH664]|uniref:SGNH/GDSL hydrolase family protein n=1 Tax=Planctomicrobium sp. SH664 TaxID=3448125 RepID=UPI003F5B3CE7
MRPRASLWCSLIILALGAHSFAFAETGTPAVKEKKSNKEQKAGKAKKAKADKAQPSKEAEPAKVNKAFEKVEDDPNLPRVLLIGDSISIGYTLPVRELLKGKANVHRPAINCGPTTRGVASIDEWIGDGKWDVIHFNFGLHDLRYMDQPNAPLDTAPPAPRQTQVPLDEYERNLTKIVESLKKTNAKLIWRNTTPVPPGSTNRVPGSELAYNEVAEKIMKANGIEIEDLHAFIVPRIQEVGIPKNVHYTDAGSQVLAEHVANTILAALPKK